MKVLGLLLISCVFATGCSLKTKIQDLNKNGGPTTSTPNPFQIKVSGGSGTMTGSSTAMDYSIGLTNRTISGATIDLTATISADRPNY